MPLSQPADRIPLHNRTIRLRGYRRSDGLFDIEAHLYDHKNYPMDNWVGGPLKAEEPMHDMSVRMTIDGNLRIVAFEAVSDVRPADVCSQAAANFSRLVGMTVKAGFVRDAQALIGGTEGCTHHRELLGQIGTAALQTLREVRFEQRARAGKDMPKPPVIDTCAAWAANGDWVRVRFPQFYTGPAPGEQSAARPAA